jgi:HEAT repeat protein
VRARRAPRVPSSPGIRPSLKTLPMTGRLAATIVLALVASGCGPGSPTLTTNPLPAALVEYIAGLAADGDPSNVPVIVPYLADRDPVVRIAACFAIEDLSGKSCGELGPKSAAYRVEGPPSSWREAVEELGARFGEPGGAERSEPKTIGGNAG